MGARKRARHVVPEFWMEFYEQTHIPAAILAGDRLHVTGHTGTLADGSFPDGAEAQIRQTFLNIGLTLEEAGTCWDDVIEITTYHVNLAAHDEILLRIAAEFLAEPYPAWTAVGVTTLFEPDALFEASCVAVVAP